MAIDAVSSDIPLPAMSPRISFSHDFCHAEAIPVEQRPNSRSKSSGFGSSFDFDFCIPECSDQNPPPPMKFSPMAKFFLSKSRRNRKSDSISFLLLHWRERNLSISIRRNVWRKINRWRKTRLRVVILKRNKVVVPNPFGVSNEAVAVALVTLVAYVLCRFSHEAIPLALRRILSERHYPRTV